MTKFSPEFRQTVIERVRSGEPQTEVAKSLGISSKTVHGWWSAAKQDLPTQELTDTEEIARLRRLLREREAEIAFLKKSLEPSWLSSRIKIIKFHAVQFLLSARREPHRKSYPLFRSAHLN